MAKKALGVSIREKSDGTRVYTVRWEEFNGEERQCKSRELPRPELEDTLADFGEFIPHLCLIPRDGIQYMTIAGATFKYPKDGGLPYLTLGVSLTLGNGLDFSFESPEMSIRMDDYTLETANNWAEKYSALAKLLSDEIIMYASGKRAQQSLDLEQEAEPDEEGGEN